MVYSWPSTLTSVPAYLLISTRSPAFKLHGDFLAVHQAAGATAITSATWGFSLAEPVRMMPALGGFFHLNHFDDNAICKWFDGRVDSSSL